MSRDRTLRTIKLVIALVIALCRPAAAGAAPLDGGPGGACLNDRDCGICGWVCSSLRGNVCVPAREGEPGQCAGNGGCACPGQICMSGACTPAPNTACSCNGDCPVGEVCDQLLFTCHEASPAFCGQPYDGYDFGPPSSGPACGCNGMCGGDGGVHVCEAQATSLPSTCASDLDCGACYQGYQCLDNICTPAGTVGWCTGPRDLMPTFPAQTRIDAGPGEDGGSGSTSGSTSGSGAKSGGCSTGSGGGLGALAMLGALVLLKRRRATLPSL